MRAGPRSIRSKMIIALFFPLSLIGLSAFLTAYAAGSAIGSVNALFRNDYFFKEVATDIESSQNHLAAYLATKDSDSLRSYMSYSRKLAGHAASLDTGIADRPDALVARNISVLLRKLILVSDKAVDYKRGRNIGEYTASFRRSERLVGFLRERISEASLIGLGSNLVTFSSLAVNLDRIRTLTVVMIFAALVLDASLIAYFSLKITDPIIHLSAEARKIASGQFDSAPIPIESSDEAGTMTEAFNVMKVSISEYIEEIRNKAGVESRLMEERVKNLEMSGLLRNAELRSLQARINPHFLFNALNAGIQLSVVEDADRTRVFLENLSALMRYSFRNFDAPVTLGEELSCLDSYLNVMAIRFPELFERDIRIDEGTRLLPMPKMIIQPLVENSFRHGFRDMAGGALVSVCARKLGDAVVLEIEDNGVGMSDEERGLVLSAAESAESGEPDAARPESGRASESGVGIVNVIQRLRLFTGRRDVLELAEGSRGGTLVRMTIPFGEGAKA